MVRWYNTSIKVGLFLLNFCEQNLVIYVEIHAIGNFLSGMDFHMQILLWSVSRILYVDQQKAVWCELSFIHRYTIDNRQWSQQYFTDI